MLMPKFVLLFNYKAETIDAMIRNPSDRVAAVRKLTDAIGGTLDAFFWMQGQYDGLAIIGAPTAMDANALSLAVSSTGTLSRAETHELIEPSDMQPLLEQAKELRAQFAPTGKPTVSAPA
jgi:uncharacterized protein with GYD domain